MEKAKTARRAVLGVAACAVAAWAAVRGWRALARALASAADEREGERE